jgi:hypothetical protein
LAPKPACRGLRAAVRCDDVVLGHHKIPLNIILQSDRSQVLLQSC